MLNISLEQQFTNRFSYNPNYEFFKVKRVEVNQVDIQLALPFTHNRSCVEDFIWNGFRKHYRANVDNFSPNLISIKVNDDIQSALGLRVVGNQPVFIEQYLTKSIESYFGNEHISRKQIGEVGNLFGTNKLFTRQLFVVTAMVAKQIGLSKLIFCATPQLKMIMKKLSLSIFPLGNADPKKIGGQIKQWGSYYDTSPELVAIDVEQANYLIECSDRYSKVSNELSTQIESIANNIIR